jgi:predicted nucleotide-binding protein
VVETEVQDAMSDTRELHAGRLRKALEFIKDIREQNITALDSKFETWKERVRQSLTVLFGEDHSYTNRFRHLGFWLTRADIGNGIHWSREDQEVLIKDLARAENVLSDALEELPITERIMSETTKSIVPQNKRTNNMPDTKKVFVVHGRDSGLRDNFFSFLRALGLQPIEWSEALKLTGKATPYIGEALESAFRNVQAVIVLLSPDDEVRLSPELWREIEDEDEKEIKLQARPNVLFEAGMAFATHPDRTILVEVGEVKPFSDIGGRHVVRLSNLAERRNEIAERIRTAGCDVSKSGNDWLNTGDFEVIRERRTNSSSYAAKDTDEEDLFEAYGINWNKEYKKRCLRCRSPLKYSSEKFGPSVLFCSSCNEKHVLKDTNGNLLTEQQAIEKLKNANK